MTQRNDIGEYQTLLEVFEHIPGVSFFVKDLEGNYLAANHNLLIRYGITEPDDIFGAGDEKFNSRLVAEEYKEDDAKIIESGLPIIDKVEPLRTELGGYEWTSAVKFPLRQPAQKISGIYGAYRPLEEAGPIAQNPRVAEAARWLNQNMAQPVRSEMIAEALGISTRQLQRILKKEVKLSITDFVVKSRVMKAAELLLRGGDKIGDIAVCVGFYDHSALNRGFRKHLGCTPQEYRSKHAK